MKTICLHGELGQHFGETHRLNVKSPAEAIRALCVTKRGFAAFLNQQEYRYRVLVDDDERTESTLTIPTSRDTIHIVPVVEGGKSPWLQTITGAVLTAVGVYTGQPWLISAGVSWGLGGVTRLLAGDPRGAENAENTPNYFFSGPVNTTQQGHCVPVLYGELEIGGALISSTIETSLYTPMVGGRRGFRITSPPVKYVPVNGASASTASVSMPLTATGAAGTRVWTINTPDFAFTVDGSNNLVGSSVPFGIYSVGLHVEIDGTPSTFADGEVVVCVYDSRFARPDVLVGRMEGLFGGNGEIHQPVESPDSLVQNAVVYLVDLLSEGPIEGFGSNAKEDIAKCIYLNDTPLRAADGSWNFPRVDFEYRLGDPDQVAINGWPLSSADTTVGSELVYGTPYVQSVSAGNDRILITVGVPALYEQQSNGDVTGTAVDIKISVQASGGSYVEFCYDAIRGKCTSRYQRQYPIELARYGDGPWNVKVERMTPTSGSSSLVNKTYIDSYTLQVSAKLKYPNCALVAIKADAQQFGSVPKRSYRLKGLQIQIPSNYDPATRVYTGEWDGTFVTDYSNNPAWVIYDMLTANRFGLGRWVDVDAIDKWSFYAIAQRCDEVVDDGLGGQEYRFTCNAYLQSADDAYRVLANFASIFWGMSFWGSNALYLAADMPSDPVAIFHDQNVGEDGFTYSGLSDQDRPNALLIGWNDPADHSRQKWAYVPDDQAIRDDGQIRQKELVAFGCTSEGQAVRFGRYLLEASLEGVSFETGFMGSTLRPGDIILIQDNARTRAIKGGRIIESDGTTHQLDGDVLLEAGRTYRLLSQLPDGSITSRDITTASGTLGFETARLTTDPFPVPLGWMCSWLVQDTTGDPAEYRVTRVREIEPERYAVEATRWDRTKFDRIDDITLEPRPTGGGAVTISGPVQGIAATPRYVVANQSVEVWIDLTWTLYANATRYEIEFQAQGQDTWASVTAQTNGASIQVPNPGSGTGSAQFRIRAVVGASKTPQATFGTSYTGSDARDWIFPSEKPALKAQKAAAISLNQSYAAALTRAKAKLPVPGDLTAAEAARDTAYSALLNYLDDTEPWEVDSVTYLLAGWETTTLLEPINMGPGGRAHWDTLFAEAEAAEVELASQVWDWLTT